MSEPDDERRVRSLRAAGCVFAEAELAMIHRHCTGQRVDEAVARRIGGLPLELAVGVAEFAGVVVPVFPGVFVPRRRAEPVVEVAAQSAREGDVLLDLGCGAGGLAAAIGARVALAQVHVSDIDPVAVRASQRLVAGSVGHVGSWWSAIPGDLVFDLVVAYLPHVPADQVGRIHGDYRQVEPLATVDGGADGLEPLDAVLDGLDERLAPGGTFVTLLADEQVDAALDRGLQIAREVDGDVVMIRRVDPAASHHHERP